MKVTKLWAAFCRYGYQPPRCPTCGHGPNNTPIRYCGKCGRAMERGDKWVIDGCILRHRNCEARGCYCRKHPCQHTRPAPSSGEGK